MSNIRLISLIYIFLSVFSLNSQVLVKTEFLDVFKSKTDSSGSLYISESYSDFENSISGFKLLKSKDGKLISHTQYRNLDSLIVDGFCKQYENKILVSIHNYKNDKLNGPFYYYFDSVDVKISGQYVNGLLNDRLATYYSNGKVRRNDTYDNGKLVKGSCFTLSGKDTSYFEFETDPMFDTTYSDLGKWLQKNIIFPSEALEENISEKIWIKFMVNTNGEIENVGVLKGYTKSLKDEACRAVKAMPKWLPGKLDGYAITTTFRIPINFYLDGGKTPVNPEEIKKNMNWVKGEDLIDPENKRTILPKVKNGVKMYTIFYLKYGDVVKKTVTETELEYVKELKFSTKKSLLKYY